MTDHIPAPAQQARVWIGSPDPAALAHRLEAAYDKVKEWPERSPTGFLDLLELRNLVPETVSILRALAAQPPAAPVEIEPRLSTSSGTVVYDHGEAMVPDAPVSQMDEFISRLVDWAYLHATEGQTWPSTKTKDFIAIWAKSGAPTQRDADVMKAAAPSRSSAETEGQP